MDIDTSRDKAVHMSDEGIVVYLKFNYRVILLVLVVIDIFHVSVNELVVRLLT